MQKLAQARARALGGQSSRARGREKDLAALEWVYRWGWSSPSIVDLVASPTRRGVCARLTRRGLLVAHPSPGGSGVAGAPATVVTLSDDGVAEVEALADALMPYDTDGRQIPWRQLRHDALVQTWTAQKISSGKIADYRTPRELAEKSERGVKQPDAVWITKTGMSVAVELELTAKKDREFHQAVLALLRSVHPGSDKRERGPFDAAVVISHSRAILDRYRKMLAPGATIQKYEQNAQRQYKPSGTLKTPDWAAARIMLELVDVFEKTGPQSDLILKTDKIESVTDGIDLTVERESAAIHDEAEKLFQYMQDIGFMYDDDDNLMFIEIPGFVIKYESRDAQWIFWLLGNGIDIEHRRGIDLSESDLHHEIALEVVRLRRAQLVTA